MGYKALYRKWRPATFDEVRGQDHIVRTLKNQVIENRIGHAYLFCGTRGTGKTSVAKIFAKAVNCEHPVDGNPCGECAACRAIDAGASMNVVEIDAASNNGIDNIRQIREEVEYPPTEGKYKVYIIDEAHMITPNAFNAFLKTLEEPPSYVIFILATTDPARIMDTVRSRCQRYDFHRINIDTITGRLSEVSDAEGIEAQEEALHYIAKKGDGSLRDAISLLDQCHAFYYDEPLTLNNVLNVLGTVDNETYSRFLRVLYSGQVGECLKQVEDLLMDGRDLGQFVSDFIWYLRDVLLAQTGEASDEMLDMTGEDREHVLEEARLIPAETIMRYLRVLSETMGQMRNSDNKRVLLETALIRLIRPEMEMNLDSLLQRMAELERKVDEYASAYARLEAAARSGALDVSSESDIQTDNCNPERSKCEDERKTETGTVSEDPDQTVSLLKNEWSSILNVIGGTAKVTLSDVTIEQTGEGQVLLIFHDEDIYQIGARQEELGPVEEYIGKTYGINLKFQTKLEKTKTEFKPVSEEVNEMSRKLGIPVDYLSQPE